MHLVVETILADEGSVVLFQGSNADSGKLVTFAVEHRYAEDLAEAVMLDEQPEVDIELWQIVGS